MLPLRLALVLLPALGLAGAVFVLAVAAPRYLAIQHYPSTPQQPIYFDHRVHVEQAGARLRLLPSHRLDRGDGRLPGR